MQSGRRLPNSGSHVIHSDWVRSSARFGWPKRIAVGSCDLVGRARFDQYAIKKSDAVFVSTQPAIRFNSNSISLRRFGLKHFNPARGIRCDQALPRCDQGFPSAEISWMMRPFFLATRQTFWMCDEPITRRPILAKARCKCECRSPFGGQRHSQVETASAGIEFNCDAVLGIAAVIQVIPVAGVVDINVIILIPVV